MDIFSAVTAVGSSGFTGSASRGFNQPWIESQLNLHIWRLWIRGPTEGLEHSLILVSVGDPGTNAPWILRDDGNYLQINSNLLEMQFVILTFSVLLRCVPCNESIYTIKN